MNQKPSLRTRSKKELSSMARRRGIPGWESMTKEQLIAALSAESSATPTKKAKPTKKTSPAKIKVPVAAKPSPKVTQRPSRNGPGRPANPATSKPAKIKKKPAADIVATQNDHADTRSSTPVSPRPTEKPATSTDTSPGKPPAKSKPVMTPIAENSLPSEKHLPARPAKVGTPVKDQIVLTVPDPYWLHAYWQLSVQSLQRAEAALAQDWFGARPILRLFDVTSHDTTSTSEAPIRDIEIHSGCNHWYIDIPQPPRSYRIDIGYRSRNGRFFPLCRSNVVSPPKAGASETLDENWTSDLHEKVTERMLLAAATADSGQTPRDLDDMQRRSNKDTPFGSGAVLPGKLKKFFFDLDAQLIVVGRTDPTATVTLNNEPVKISPDGTFAQRYSLPDSRQIIPAVATSADGMEEQTIVLAIERNTKRLDPMLHDLYGDS
jgi:hypothetical protein